MNSLKTYLINNREKFLSILLISYGLTYLIDTKINLGQVAFFLSLLIFFLLKKAYTVQIYSSKSFKIYIFLLIIFLIGVFLSTIFTQGNLAEYKSRFLGPLCASLSLLLIPLRKKQYSYILLSFTLPFFINAMFVIYQAIFESNLRPVGFCTNHYMFLAVLNSILLPLLLTISLSENINSNILKIICFSTVIINIPAIIFENTRIIWIAIFSIFPIIIYLSINNKIKAFFLILCFALYTTFIFSNMPQSVNRAQSITDTSYSNQSNYERILMWKSATNMFIDHPLFGVGIGNYYNEYIENYKSPLSRENQHHPHNVLLTILSETGIFGILGYVSLWCFLFIYSLKNYIRNKNFLSLAFISILLSLTINGLTDSILFQIGYKGPTTLFFMLTNLYFILNKDIFISYKFEGNNEKTQKYFK